jgi:hypothetical protein
VGLVGAAAGRVEAALAAHTSGQVCGDPPAVWARGEGIRACTAHSVRISGPAFPGDHLSGDTWRKAPGG